MYYVHAGFKHNLHRLLQTPAMPIDSTSHSFPLSRVQLIRASVCILHFPSAPFPCPSALHHPSANSYTIISVLTPMSGTACTLKSANILSVPYFCSSKCVGATYSASVSVYWSSNLSICSSRLDHHLHCRHRTQARILCLTIRLWFVSLCSYIYMEGMKGIV